MKISKTSCFALVLLVWQSAFAVRDDALCKAYAEGAMASVSCRVVDEENRPVAGATVRVEFKSTVQSIGDASFCAMTDREGASEVEHLTNWKVVCAIWKEGYYESRFEVSFYDTKRNAVKGGKWVSDALSRQVILRRIRAPESLSIFPESRRMGTWRIPVKDEWIGFDFEVFDWTAPHGKGRSKDVLLRFSSERIDHMHGKSQMDVCFTNSPYAGAYVGKADELSDLKIPHVADERQAYTNRLSFMKSTLTSQRKDDFPSKDGFVVFRTRTRADDSGTLIAACYGVISGVWTSGETTMRMEDAAFNPKENDLNVEDGYYLRRLLRQYERRRSSSAPNDANLEPKRDPAPRP